MQILSLAGMLLFRYLTASSSFEVISSKGFLHFFPRRNTSLDILSYVEAFVKVL